MKKTLALIACLCALASASRAQNQFEDAVKQLNSDNVRGYLQPFINSFGANLNSGLYHSANIPETGISVRLDLIGMGTLIGDGEKTYSAVPPQPFDQTPVQTATIFGERGTVVHLAGAPNVTYQFQNGQVKATLAPLAAPQLTIGTIAGTQAVIRYAPIPTINDFPKVTLFGIGARHSISRYLPESPVDLAAGAFYQSLDIGDIISAHTFNISAQASKSFAILTLYGGVQWENSSIDLNYTYTGPGSTPNTKVGISMDGENKVRATIGAGLNLAILNLAADISVGKVTVVSGGLGFGF